MICSETIVSSVIANCITIGIVVFVASCTTLEIKRELFLNGRSTMSYRLKFF